MAYIPTTGSCIMREDSDSLTRIAIALERILTSRYDR
jgi:hypothetical protein